MPPIAFVTGITGQDGSYLTELLLSKGYEVHGLMRRASTFNTDRIDHVYQDPHDPARRLYLHLRRPDRWLDARQARRGREAGRALQPRRAERTSACRSTCRSTPPTRRRWERCGCSRASGRPTSGRASTRLRRRRCSGTCPLLKMRERRSTRPRHTRWPRCSPIRWPGSTERRMGCTWCGGSSSTTSPPDAVPTFVTRKVTQTVARICAGKEDRVYLGNLEASRDWGYAPEYVEAMWRMLQDGRPSDYVLATGDSHTVQELCEAAFGLVGLDWRNHVEVDARYMRPKDVGLLTGDASRAREQIGWEPKVRIPPTHPDHAGGGPPSRRSRSRGALTPPVMDHRPEWARLP